MYWHRDVVVGLDGTLHKAKLAHVTDQVWFDDRPALALGFIANSLRLAVDGDGNAFAAVNHWEDGNSSLVWRDGRTVQVHDGNGAYTAAVRALTGQPELYALRKDQTGVDVFDASGLTTRHYDVPYASTGIHRIEPDGYPVTEVDPRRRAVTTLHGVTLYNCAENQGWTVGHADGTIDGQKRGVAVLVAPDGTMQMFPYATDQSPANPRIAVLGPTVWVALSNEETPEPDAVPWKPWVPWVEPAAAPPVSPPPQPQQVAGPPSAPTAVPVSTAVSNALRACQQDTKRLRAELAELTQELATTRAANAALADELKAARLEQARVQRAINRLPTNVRSVVEQYVREV
jgi:hypothetical protein